VATTIHFAALVDRPGSRSWFTVTYIDATSKALRDARPYAELKRADSGDVVYVNPAQVAYLEPERSSMYSSPEAV
jgi:hypothetical protein